MSRILIATPCYRTLEPCYLPGVHSLLTQRADDLEVLWEVVFGLPVNFGRNHLVKRAKERKVDEILFVDADMEWTGEDFMRIQSHREVDVVGNLYPRKRPGRPHYHVNLKEGCDIDPKTGLCEVNAIGTGFLKIRMHVFDAIEKKFPQFSHDEGFEYFPMGVVNRTLLGEDYYFCHLARECGFKIHADFGARVIPHWGQIAFPLEGDSHTDE